MPDKKVVKKVKSVKVKEDKSDDKLSEWIRVYRDLRLKSYGLDMSHNSVYLVDQYLNERFNSRNGNDEMCTIIAIQSYKEGKNVESTFFLRTLMIYYSENNKFWVRLRYNYINSEWEINGSACGFDYKKREVLRIMRSIWWCDDEFKYNDLDNKEVMFSFKLESC